MKIRIVSPFVVALLLLVVPLTGCSSSKGIDKRKLTTKQEQELLQQKKDIERQDKEIEDLKRQKYQDKKFEKYSK